MNEYLATCTPKRNDQSIVNTSMYPEKEINSQQIDTYNKYTSSSVRLNQH